MVYSRAECLVLLLVEYLAYMKADHWVCSRAECLVLSMVEYLAFLKAERWV